MTQLAAMATPAALYSVTVTPETPQRFSPIAAADALDLVLYEINLIEDARA